LRIVAIANQKGGCGKTTTSINLAAGLAHLNRKTLLVDFDPQGHSTCGLGVSAEELPNTLYDLLRSGEGRRPSISEVMVDLEPNLSLLPTYVVLSKIEEEYAQRQDFEGVLARALDIPWLEQQGVEFILIDCPPNLGKLTYSAFESASDVLIPIEPSFFSLHGLAKISETLELVKSRRILSLEIHALMTLFDGDSGFAKEVHDNIYKNFGSRLLKTVIHTHSLMKECSAAGQSILQYAPESSPAKDYMELALEFLDRMDGHKRGSELSSDAETRMRFGPKRVIGGMMFQYYNPVASRVQIAGDFSGWIPVPLFQRSTDGVWQIVVPITSGHYRYKFIVDGDWLMDPAHPFQMKNNFGSFDSYVELSRIA